MAMLKLAVIAFFASFVASQASLDCSVHAARAVDDALDSAVYIMASIARCDKAHGGDDIRCALDVSSAIESVTGMINVILKAVDECEGLDTEGHDCGLAVGVLTESYAGLSAASAGIIAKCPNELNHFHSLSTVGQQMANTATDANSAQNVNDWQQVGGGTYTNLQGGASFAQCVVNIKSTMKSLFKAIKRIMTLGENCADPDSLHCDHNALKVMAAFVGLGEFLSGAIGKCTPLEAPNAIKTKEDALCAQYSIKLFHQLGVVDRAGIEMARKCELTPAQRLYLDNEDVQTQQAASSNPVTLALAALLPISAVLSFVVGSRFAKSRRQPQHDEEALMAVQEE